MSDADSPDRERIKAQVDRAVAEFKTGSISRAIEIMEGLAADLDQAPDQATLEEASEPEPEPEPVECPECDREFDSLRGMRVHAAQVHPDEEEAEEEADDE